MAKNVVIIGGGASGLMAAIWASRLGAAVTVLEKNDKPGRKLLATGNGRCNLPIVIRMHRATAREIRSVHHGFSNSLPNRTPNSFLNSSASASGAVKAGFIRPASRHSPFLSC